VAGDLAALASDATWFERDTTPEAIAAALRRLIVERRHGGEAGEAVPARVLNLVAVVDRQWRGEIENRLERVGRYHASRTVLCAIEPRRATIDARATIITDRIPRPGEFATTHEHVVLDVGAEHVEHLDTIVDPLVVTDLPTMLWAPHGHQEAIDVLLPLGQVVLLDSVDDPDLEDGIARARALADRAYVVDLAWLRSTPWRERVAASFDPPRWRSQLPTITAVDIRHHPQSTAAGVLFAGWLASRLGWRPDALTERRDGCLQCRARSRRAEVLITLTPDRSQAVRGLAGITVETGQGTRLSLDRGPGGLRARRSVPRAPELAWTLMGASRGEPGILGEGIRQALLRDPTYRPALEAAAVMVS
jgi:glucose-6-phosphate dehydrogenase assembly protein OpcA